MTVRPNEGLIKAELYMRTRYQVDILSTISFFGAQLLQRETYATAYGTLLISITFITIDISTAQFFSSAVETGRLVKTKSVH